MNKKVQKNTKLKIMLGFLAILAITISVFARFTSQFPGDLYLTLRLQSFNNHILLSVMQWVSFILGAGVQCWWLLLSVSLFGGA